MEHLYQPTTLGPDDLFTFAGIVVGYGIYRYVVTYGFLVRLMHALKVKAGMRFVHRSFDLIHYVLSFGIGLLASAGRPYQHCIYWTVGCKAELAPTSGAFVCTVIEKLYWMLFSAYYMVDAFFIWTVPYGMVPLACHHVATCTMSVFAVLCRVPGIGLSMMVLHDLSDVPLYLGKVAGYLGWRYTKDVSMVIFVFTYTLFRMMNLPMIAYYAWANYSSEVYLPTLYVITVSLLTVLISLHVFWYWKIVKSVVALITVGEKGMRDTRSD
jgi:hypothetical protein